MPHWKYGSTASKERRGLSKRPANTRRHRRRRAVKLLKMTIKHPSWMIFGADAAHQRADDYAEERAAIEKIDWLVRELGTIDAPFERFGLDAWGRNPDDGIIYSYVAMRA